MPKKAPAGRNRPYAPETLMMSHGFDPALSEGAVKPPTFAASTYTFPSATVGREFFERIAGKDGKDAAGCLLYGRFNHPGMQIFEERLAVWEGAEACAGFGSGMAAIFTTLFELLRPGDLVIYSNPLYGGTDGLIKKVLPSRVALRSVGFDHDESFDQVVRKVEAMRKAHGPLRVAAVFVETPANPTNVVFDLALCKRLRDHFGATLIVDNTFLGPLFQKPFAHGADLVVYSCTKYIGGHSDLIAGACLGSRERIDAIKRMRNSVGDMLDPQTASLLLRRLETLKIRMEAQTRNAIQVANFLLAHPKVSKIYFPGFYGPGATEQHRIYHAQCTGPGAVMSFDVRSRAKGAYRFLDALQETGIIKLAVSLGSTESLAQHPASMTHAGVDLETRERYGITDAMIRLSVGLENADDLKSVLDDALKKV